MKAQPINHVFLSLTKPLQDTIRMGDIDLYLDGSYRPEWNATIVGKVAGLPQNPKGEDSGCVHKLNIGDEVLFDYSVVAERKFEADGDHFTEVTKDSPYYQRFVNGKGEVLTIVAMQGKITLTWSGIYQNARKEFVDGMQGSESDINRWKAQFNFGSTQKFFFKNLLDTGSGDVWKAEYRDIFAKVVDGELVTVGDRIILEPIDVPIPEQVLTQMGLEIPKSSISARLRDRGKVVSAPEYTKLQKGDVVGFEERFLEKYDFNDKKYYLIKARRALGVWEE